MKFRMRVQQVLFFCFVSAVWDGNTEEINIHKGNEGGDASVKCHFSFSNSTKFFCKGGCEDGNILIETTEDQAQRGRYSLKYGQVSVRNSFFLRVTITQLNRSDSGQYTCGLGETLSSSSFQKFEICVTGENHSSASSELSGWFTGYLFAVLMSVPMAVLMVVFLLFLCRIKKKNTNTDVALISYVRFYDNERTLQQAATV